MRRVVIAIIAGGVLVPTRSIAADADAQEMARDVGAVLAWRLGPELVEEHCRSVDPDGAEARSKALKSWLDRNASLIKEVDTRVAEVVPLVAQASPEGEAVEAVRKQVRAMLMEITFTGRTAEQSKAICQAEANPASPRWNNTGLPQVPGSLAALHDWKVRRASTNSSPAD
jgi:hypothetical protein